MNNFLAIDLGASSYRMILNNGIENIEIYRASDHLLTIKGEKFWDITKIYNSIIGELKKLKNSETQLTSLAINSWGCDFVELTHEPIFNFKGELCNQVYGDCYLNQKHNIDEQIISEKDLFDYTAIRCQPFNTINRHKRITHPITFIASYLNYLLTGYLEADFTIASTSQFLDKIEDEYNSKVLDSLQLDKELLPPLRIAGITRKPIIHKELSHINVVFGPGHDTAYALNHGVKNSLILNVGSWIIIGANIDVVEKFNEKYSYERGLLEKYKVVVNQIGMNGFNELLTHNNVNLDYDQIEKQLNLVDNCYSLQCSEAVALDYDLSQEWQVNIASFLNALATLTSNNIMQFINDINPLIDKVYVVGGGSKNYYYIDKLLKELPSNLKVEFGPQEATVMGNIDFQRKVYYGTIKK